MLIHGIAASSHIDTSGEILDVKGHDISDLVEGRGVLNFEHCNDAESIIGSIRFAKKIYNEKDCENENERKFWELAKTPFVYIIAELFDDEEHSGAIAVRAMIDYYKKRNEKVLAGFSIEGVTLDRDGNKLLRSVGRRVALTLRPANRACVSDVLSDPNISKVIKSESFGLESLTKTIETDSVVLDDDDYLSDIQKELNNLNKTLTAGGGDVAPSQLTGGAALSVEDLTVRNRMKAALRDWNKVRPLKEVIKAALPEVSESFIDHFVGIAEDLSLKKGESLPVRIGAQDSLNMNADNDQKRLVEGLFLDPNKMTEEHNGAGIGINDYGTQVKMMLPQKTDDGRCSGHNASAYYKIAKDAFGMQDHVPVTNHFDTEMIQPNNRLVAQQHDPSQQSLISPELADKAFEKHHNDGSLYKMAVMDMIMGVGDRNNLKMSLGSSGKLQNIDNGNSFNYQGHAPTYIDMKAYGNNVLPNNVYEWLLGIDPKKIATSMYQHDITPEKIKKAIYALKYMQKFGGSRPIKDLWYNVMNGGEANDQNS